MSAEALCAKAEAPPLPLSLREAFTMIRMCTFVLMIAIAPLVASAQTLGAFRWQLQPYCNVITLTVSQVGGVFSLDGYDDQCGAGQRASVAGTAFFNPDGSIGFGLALVTAAGTPLHVDVTLSLATLGGTWRDSTGASGALIFNPAATSGTPRPAPIASFAAGLVVGNTTFFGNGSFVAGASSAGTVPVSGAGRRAMWYGRRSAFRAGQVDAGEWDDDNIGYASVAFGQNTTASGGNSFAAGLGTMASGAYSAAFGLTTVASNSFSMAWGYQSTASGPYSTAGGYQATASGTFALAYGSGVTASGGRSVALGTNVSTASRRGSFIFGDDSGVANTVPTADHQFVVRATGGVRFLTSTSLVNGCEVGATTGNFVCTGTITSSSDRARKRDIEWLDGEDVLARVARIPVTTWSFIDEPGVRHAGPMAQDFRAAFGLGENDVTISYVDINGINMRAIQALEQRTRDLIAEIAMLRERLAQIDSRQRQQ